MTQEELIQAFRFKLAWQESKKVTTKTETGNEKTVIHRYEKFNDSKSVGLDGVLDLLDYCDKYNEKHELSKASVEVFRVKVKE